MKKLIPPVDTMCIVCGKPVKKDENYGFSKTNSKKILFFHEECLENLKKKE